MDTGNGRGTGPGGAGSSPCPACGEGTSQSGPGGKLAGREGPGQKQGAPREGGNARGRKWCGREAWLLALALAPTCCMTLNKSPPSLWGLSSPTVGVSRGAWLPSWPRNSKGRGAKPADSCPSLQQTSSAVRHAHWALACEVSLGSCYYILGCFHFNK